MNLPIIRCVNFLARVFLITSFLFFANGPTPALASSILVNTASDETTPGDGCSLREAITNADNGNQTYGDCAPGTSASNTITFSVSGPIVLNGAKGVLSIAGADLTITGPMTISGANSSQIFAVAAGVSLTLDNLTLTNALNSTDGGAIVSRGTLNINNSKFLNNQAASGFSGGAIQSFGAMNIVNSEFGNNSAGNGGALFAKDSSVTSITGSVFHDNSTTNTTNGFGGAILAWNGAQMSIGSTNFISNTARQGGAAYVTSVSVITLTQEVTLSGNTGTYGFGGSGGGIYNAGTANLTNVMLNGNPGVYGAGIYNSGNVNLTNVTVSGNPASSNGGGIYNDKGTAILTSVTLNGNTTPAGSGAGIYSIGGTLNLTNVTVSGNRASTVVGGTGGGIVMSGGNVTLTNVTLSGNVATNVGGIVAYTAALNLKNTLIERGASGSNCSAALGGSFNLSDDGSCGFGTGRDNVSNLLLGPLADNGGFTKTHLPGAGSAAIDNGTGIGCPPADQRGMPRPFGLACDVGSVERQKFERGALFLPLILR